jgi:hypothetical protein
MNSKLFVILLVLFFANAKLIKQGGRAKLAFQKTQICHDDFVNECKDLKPKADACLWLPGDDHGSCVFKDSKGNLHNTFDI